MGHFIPMVEFAKRIILKNFSVTLIIPDSDLHPNEQRSSLAELPEGMNVILLPPAPLEAFQTETDANVICFTTVQSLPSLRNVLRSLVETTNLVALVVDLFGTAAFDVANEFNVSPYMFFPSTAMALALFLYLPRLDASVSCEYKDLPGLLQIPGCIPLHAGDLSQPFQDRKSFDYIWFLNEVKRYTMAEGIVVNTFNEMEDRAIKALRHEQEPYNNYPPIYPVGPLVRQRDVSTSTTTEIEDSESALMMKWLDDQPRGSVLFVCFGSLGLLSTAQLHELAFGLEMSKKGFLWVVRSSNGNPQSFLPQDFVENTKGRGLLVSNWAPQLLILSHGSIGGFLTHCGWNSVLESIVNGVPMIAWPLYAEQKMNAAMLAEDLKIAVRVQVNNADGLVGRIEIAKSVKNLMGGKQGEQLRKQTRALKDAAKMAISEDGSSAKSLADLAYLWKEKKIPA